MKQLDKGTFGNTEVAEILVEHLNKCDAGVIKRVSNLIHDFNVGVNQIKKMNNPQFQIRFLNHLRQHTLDHLKFDNQDVVNFSHNFITTKYRKTLIEIKRVI